MTNNLQHINLTKSKERVQKHGEVFTPAWVVNDMLDMLPEDVWDIGKTFLEPACGEGAFLIEVYKRKLEIINTDIQEDWEWQAAIATSSLYGVELLEDNAEKCKINLVNLFATFYNQKFPETQDEEIIETIKFLINANIIRGNFLTQRKCLSSCGNKCNKCELIAFSEWTPLADYKLKRKDYLLEEMIKVGEKQKSSVGTLFAEEHKKESIGLIKEYQPVNWKKIRYATE
jgi:hypothetical protein